MRLGGILTTRPRLAFVRAYCAHHAFQGSSWVSGVGYMMQQLLEDQDDCGQHDIQTDKLAATTRTWQDSLTLLLLNAINE